MQEKDIKGSGLGYLLLLHWYRSWKNSLKVIVNLYSIVPHCRRVLQIKSKQQSDLSPVLKTCFSLYSTGHPSWLKGCQIRISHCSSRCGIMPKTLNGTDV